MLMGLYVLHFSMYPYARVFIPYHYVVNVVDIVDVVVNLSSQI